MDLDKFNIPRYLRSLPLFSSTADEELVRLAAGCSLLTDFDRTYPGEADAAPTPDMGLSQEEACATGCAPGPER